MTLLQHERPPFESLSQAQSDFLAQLLTLTGDTRLLWLPEGDDTTTATDKSLNGKTITWDATVAGRLSRLGKGYAQSFSGTGQFGTVPDAANLSFGDASNDSAFSMFALCNPSAQAAVRKLISKESASNNEYALQLGSTDLLTSVVYDQSVPATESQLASGAITEGAWQLLGSTYSGAGGGSASAGIALYRDGVVFASAASDSGVYVAMENLTSNVFIGGTSGGASLFAGSMALVVICQKQLSASEMWAIKVLCNSYFGLSL